MSFWTGLTFGLLSLAYWSVYLGVVLVIPLWCSLKVSYNQLDTNEKTLTALRQKWVLYWIAVCLVEFVFFPVKFFTLINFGFMGMAKNEQTHFPDLCRKP
jgi:hypothetical protein